MTSTKILAKNSAMMYGRMAISMIVSLYTSRIILKALGVEDYGIYNLVGSIVVMFNSLRTIFCSSTQRFVNYEMGRNNEKKLVLVFNMSIIINLIISVVFFILVECVGQWFFNTKINIDPSRFFAANVAFQLSVISAVSGLFMTTFDAFIVAHERMDFYAGMAILDVFAKLLLAYLLTVMSGDRLIIYAIIIFAQQSLFYFVNILFCLKNFKELRFKRCWDKQYFKKMTTFAGWNFLGNTSYALTQNGMNMVLNVFGGPVVNAARGIAFQVNNALQQAINNIVIVIKPYAIQTYAKGEYSKAFDILILSSKIYYTIQLLIVIVFSFFTRDIIYLWLGQVPEYVVPFLIIILWYSIVRAIHNPIDVLFFSVGNIKYYQICEGIVLATPVLFAYLALKQGASFYYAFLIQLIVEVINLFFVLLIAKKVCKLDLLLYFRRVIFPCCSSFLIYLFFFYLANTFFVSGFLRLANTLFAIVIQVLFMYYIGLNKAEQMLIMTTIKSLIKK